MRLLKAAAFRRKLSFAFSWTSLNPGTRVVRMLDFVTGIQCHPRWEGSGTVERGTTEACGNGLLLSLTNMTVSFLLSYTLATQWISLMVATTPFSVARMQLFLASRGDEQCATGTRRTIHTHGLALESHTTLKSECNRRVG